MVLLLWPTNFASYDESTGVTGSLVRGFFHIARTDVMDWTSESDHALEHRERM